MKNIAVIGSGTMGNGIAHLFAQYGYKVNLIDVSEEALKKAVATIDKNLGRQVEKGTITAATRQLALTNITPTTSFKDGPKQIRSHHRGRHRKRGVETQNL